MYIYNRSKEPMYFHFTMWSLLLFHAFLSASIRLTLSCLELSYLIPKVSHGKPELPTTTTTLILLQLRPIRHNVFFSLSTGKEVLRPGGV